jgi:hypothetical protein
MMRPQQVVKWENHQPGLDSMKWEADKKIVEEFMWRPQGCVVMEVESNDEVDR